jgi:hypothetical protein
LALVDSLQWEDKMVVEQLVADNLRYEDSFQWGDKVGVEN